MPREAWVPTEAWFANSRATNLFDYVDFTKVAKAIATNADHAKQGTFAADTSPTSGSPSFGAGVGSLVPTVPTGGAGVVTFACASNVGDGVAGAGADGGAEGE